MTMEQAAPYLLTPKDRVCRAQSVKYTEGTVRIEPERAYTLQYKEGEDKPYLILDLGRSSPGGYPVISVKAQKGEPVLRLAYSDWYPYLLSLIHIYGSSVFHVENHFHRSDRDRRHGHYAVSIFIVRFDRPAAQKLHRSAVDGTIHEDVAVDRIRKGMWITMNKLLGHLRLSLIHILALNKGESAYTSSSNMDGQTPQNAFDGNPGTNWQNSGNSFPAWLQVDLGSKTDVNGLWVSQWSNRIKFFKIHVSDDGQNWSTAFYGRVTDAAELGKATELSIAFPTVQARFVRLTIIDGVYDEMCIRDRCSSARCSRSFPRRFSRLPFAEPEWNNPGETRPGRWYIDRSGRRLSPDAGRYTDTQGPPRCTGRPSTSRNNCP